MALADVSTFAHGLPATLDRLRGLEVHVLLLPAGNPTIAPTPAVTDCLD